MANGVLEQIEECVLFNSDSEGYQRTCIYGQDSQPHAVFKITRLDSHADLHSNDVYEVSQRSA